MTPVTRKIDPERRDTQKGGPKTRLEAARWEAGYPGADGLARFARRVRRCPVYVRRIELHGRAPLSYAQEAQRHLRCHMNLFMWPDWSPQEGVKVPVEHTPAIDKEQTGPTKAGLTEHGPDGRGGAPETSTNARRLLAQEAATLALRRG